MSRRCSKTTSGATEGGTIATRGTIPLLAGLATLAPAAAIATALPAPDLSPLIATIGLPATDEGARLAPPGATAWRVGVVTASHSMQDAGGTEIVLFDGETTRVSASFEYRVNERLQLGIEIPYLLHESGGLDGFVANWHEWFGFPNGLRDLVPDDRLDFRYQDAGELQLDVRSNRRGPGDARLLAAWQLGADADSATALRAAVKLPTGDSGRLTGSGAADLSLGLVGDYGSVLGNDRFDAFYRAHVTLVGRPDLLGDRAEPVIGSLAGGIGYALGNRVTLALQATLRSAAYDSDLDLLGESALLLNIGGTIELAERLQLTISVGEDVNVNTAPDVTLGLSLNYRPAAGR